VIDDFLTPEEVSSLGLAAAGRDLSISRHALFFGADRLSIADHTRIDAFCIVSASLAGIKIGRYVHISAYCSILGHQRVEIGDFVNVSPRCTILSSNDDFSGATMVGPMVPQALRGVVEAPVFIRDHAVLGTASIVLPGVTIGESAAVGAASLVKTDVNAYSIVAGVPARMIGRRQSRHRELSDTFLAEVDRAE
jgi:galactoside O-acetyltransferase